MLDESSAKFYYTLMAIALILVFGYFCATGVKVGCDGPPFEEVGLVIGEPCPPETPTPEPEKVIVYRTVTVYQPVTETAYWPVIEPETVKYLSLLIVPLVFIGVGAVLMARALWKAEWWG
jgi:hypothetical protein